MISVIPLFGKKPDFYKFHCPGPDCFAMRVVEGETLYAIGKACAFRCARCDTYLLFEGFDTTFSIPKFRAMTPEEIKENGLR